MTTALFHVSTAFFIVGLTIVLLTCIVRRNSVFKLFSSPHSQERMTPLPRTENISSRPRQLRRRHRIKFTLSIDFLLSLCLCFLDRRTVPNFPITYMQWQPPCKSMFLIDVFYHAFTWPTGLLRLQPQSVQW